MRGGDRCRFYDAILLGCNTNLRRFLPTLRPKVLFAFFGLALAVENGQVHFFFFEDFRALIMVRELRVNTACSSCHAPLNLLTELLSSQLSI